MHEIDTIKFAQAIRINALRMVHRAKASHIGSALSISDIVAVLYGGVMNYDPSDILWDDRDRLILSKGHACVAIYAALYEIGVLTQHEIMTYGDKFSPLMNHISHKVRGVEFSTGSLGHGLPFSVGKAMAAKLFRKKWKTYVILGDGEMDEGSNWEAIMFAAHHNLDNLVAIIDCNNLQSLTTTKITLNLEPLADKLIAFGWNVIEVDGHNHCQLGNALNLVSIKKPLAIIARTIKGKGVSFMEDQVDWHYRNPNDSELRAALEQLGVNT